MVHYTCQGASFKIYGKKTTAPSLQQAESSNDKTYPLLFAFHQLSVIRAQSASRRDFFWSQVYPYYFALFQSN